MVGSHAAIDPERIGLWGISQAGYVVPLCPQRTAGIAFMIVVGRPGMNGIGQTAYLIRRQRMSEGVPKDGAHRGRLSEDGNSMTVVKDCTETTVWE